MQALATVAVVLCVAWTFIPLLRHEAWWIRAFDFPRVQVLALSCASLLGFVATHDLANFVEVALVCAMTLCIAYQLFHIAPYTSLWPQQLQSASNPSLDRTLSLITANVLTSNRNAGGLIDQVRMKEPDLLLAVETDHWWQEQLDELGADYPHSVKHPLNNLYGMHLYSKLKLVEPKIEFLVEQDRPSIHVTVELRSGAQVKLHCLHPAPPSPTENESSIERDAELVIVARSIENADTPVIVVGDLNDVAWSSTTCLFQRISGLLDPRIGRGIYNTFHARWPFLRWPLDHVFCSRHFTLIDICRLNYFGSDHFPIYASLCLEPWQLNNTLPNKASEHDQERADKKLDDADTELTEV